MKLNTIYSKDCLIGMRKLSNNSIDLVIADFPYNISNYGNSITMVGPKIKRADFGEWDKFNFNEYCDWVILIFKEFERLLGQKHQVYAWFDNHYSGHYVYLIEKKTEFTQKCPIVCYKRNPIPQYPKRNFRSSFDMCVLFTKDKDKKCEPFNFLSQGEMKNVQEFNLRKLTKHPTEKNLKLVQRFIKISSNEGDIVLDPFLGSGTTAVACIETGRHYIGFETKKVYFEMAKKRVARAVYQREFKL